MNNKINIALIILVCVCTLFLFGTEDSKKSEVHNHTSIADQSEEAEMLESALNEAYFRFNSSNMIVESIVNGCFINIKMKNNNCEFRHFADFYENRIKLTEIKSIEMTPSTRFTESVIVSFYVQDEIYSRLAHVGVDGLLSKEVLDGVGIETRKIIRGCDGSVGHMSYGFGSTIIFHRRYVDELLNRISNYREKYCNKRS